MDGQAEADSRALPKLGPYRIVGEIGRGGMGIVYRGVKEESACHVAIKTVRADDRRLLAGLRAEVMALRKVHHPSVVSILDEGLSEQPPWYAMELVDGPTLAHFNQELWRPFGLGDDVQHTTSLDPSQTATISTPTPQSGYSGTHAVRAPARQTLMQSCPAAGGQLARVLTIYRGLCAPLAHIHAQGLVHGDIKPNNVLLRGDGVPVIMDFGLASRALGSVGREDIEGFRRLLGTVLYVSPEQIRGDFVDARTDLYSLGCMLYETLAGRPPFVGPNILRQHEEAQALPLTDLVEGVPRELDELVQSLLAKRPADRIGHVDDLIPVLSRLGAGAPAPATSAPEPARLPHLYRPDMVGRSDAISRLQQLCDDTERGKGALVAISGESGVGKTFLAAAVARHATLRRFQVVTCQSLNLDATAERTEIKAGPLHPLRSLFNYLLDRCWEGESAQKRETTERLLGPRAKLLAAYAPALVRLTGQEDHPPPAPLPPEAARQRLFVALAETLGRLAADAPLVLIVDDLHWADELTLDFLRWLPPDFFKRTRMMLVCLYRSDAATPALETLAAREDGIAMPLGRLDDAAVRLIVEAMLSMHPAPRSLVDFVWRHSEGNPFFVSEYLRLAASKGVLQRRDGKWVLVGEERAGASLDDLQLPGSIVELIDERLGAFSAREREVVEAAAILGREFDEAALAETSGVDDAEIAGLLREMVARHVVEPMAGLRYRFVHDKIREVAYARVSDERRRALHAAAARMLERRPEGAAGGAAVLAHHFKQADDVGKATQYLEGAATQALSRFANHEAQQYFKALLEWGVAGTDGDLRRAAWERGLGDAMHGQGKLEEARLHLGRAVELLGFPLPGGRISLAAATTGELLAQVKNRLSPGDATSDDPATRRRCLDACEAYDRLLQIFYYQGLLLPMFNATLRGVNLGESGGPSPQLARAYANAHAAAGVIPNRKLADLYHARAKGVLEQAYDPEVDSYLQLLVGVYRSGIAEWSSAREALDRGLALARELGFERRADEMHLGLANWEFLQGRFAAALQNLDEQALSAGRGDAQAQAWQLLMRGQVSLMMSADEDALARARLAERLVGLQRSELIWLNALLAAAILRTGDLPQARHYAELALKTISSGPSMTFYCIQAYFLMGEVLLDLWERHETGGETPRALERSAVRACREMRRFAGVFPAARPRALILDGRLARLRGNESRSRKSWTEASRWATRLGMPLDEAVAKLLLARSLPTFESERWRLTGESLRIARGLEAWTLSDEAKTDLAQSNQESNQERDDGHIH